MINQSILPDSIWTGRHETAGRMACITYRKSQARLGRRVRVDNNGNSVERKHAAKMKLGPARSACAERGTSKGSAFDEIGVGMGHVLAQIADG
jgi:hypothetical protein